MRRRALLATVTSAVGLSGCLFETESGSAADTASPPATETATSVRRTADGVRARFQIVDSHAPTDDTASATFDEARVTVTGTMDPSGCNRPTLTAVRYNTADGVIHLTVGVDARYQTADVECGNASYDYRAVLSVAKGQPDAVEVVHEYESKPIQSFNLERG